MKQIKLKILMRQKKIPKVEEECELQLEQASHWFWFQTP